MRLHAGGSRLLDSWTIRDTPRRKSGEAEGPKGLAWLTALGAFVAYVAYCGLCCMLHGVRTLAMYVILTARSRAVCTCAIACICPTQCHTARPQQQAAITHISAAHWRARPSGLLPTAQWILVRSHVGGVCACLQGRPGRLRCARWPPVQSAHPTISAGASVSHLRQDCAHPH